MAEFKKLSDVAVVETPAETANVLIEEDGVIKKAPKTAVGGSGGNEPDMVITVSAKSNTQITSDNYTITDGSVDNVFAAFHDGRYPVIKVRFYSNDNNAYTAIREEYDAYVCTYGESIWFSFISLNPFESGAIYLHKVYMNGDGALDSSNLQKATLTVVS